jgi:hypothetical protein
MSVSTRTSSVLRAVSAPTGLPGRTPPVDVGDVVGVGAQAIIQAGNPELRKSASPRGVVAGDAPVAWARNAS